MSQASHVEISEQNKLPPTIDPFPLWYYARFDIFKHYLQQSSQSCLLNLTYFPSNPLPHRLSNNQCQLLRMDDHFP